MSIKNKIAAFDGSKNDPIYLDECLKTLMRATNQVPPEG
jgi:hypothetical protein